LARDEGLPLGLEVRDCPVHGLQALLIGCVTGRDLKSIVIPAAADHVRRGRAEVTPGFLVDTLA
jgi:hypothetical protein